MKRMLPVLLMIATPVVAAEPKDPMNRDEDISRTELHVEHIRRADGLHEYVYTVEAPASNQGTVADFSVDLSCNVAFPPKRLPDVGSKPGYTGIDAYGGTISPTVIDTDDNAAVKWGIRRSGQAYWQGEVNPGESKVAMRLISSVPPGSREYMLRPEWNTDPDEWAYPQHITEAMPWVTDFVVKGEVMGPACPDIERPEKKTRTRRNPNEAIEVNAEEETEGFAESLAV